MTCISSRCHHVCCWYKWSLPGAHYDRCEMYLNAYSCLACDNVQCLHEYYLKSIQHNGVDFSVIFAKIKMQGNEGTSWRRDWVSVQFSSERVALKHWLDAVLFGGQWCYGGCCCCCLSLRISSIMFLSESPILITPSQYIFPFLLFSLIPGNPHQGGCCCCCCPVVIYSKNSADTARLNDKLFFVMKIPIMWQT